MSVITTKFSIGDVCYTFTQGQGIISRAVIHELHIINKNSDSEIQYTLTNITPSVTGRVNTGTEYEQNLYTETEVKDLANTWLINKSISIFSNAGL